MDTVHVQLDAHSNWMDLLKITGFPCKKKNKQTNKQTKKQNKNTDSCCSDSQVKLNSLKGLCHGLLAYL